MSKIDFGLLSQDIDKLKHISEKSITSPNKNTKEVSHASY